jgi:MSHA biogenesis protein MshL
MIKRTCRQLASLAGLALFLSCSSTPMAPSNSDLESRHIVAPDTVPGAANIPDIVRPLPLVSAPVIEPPIELYSVVVQQVPVRELLFAMARDASINVDVHSAVFGVVSINAIDQTLPQILERIARQVDVRWRFERNDYLIVEPDLPFIRSYRMDYVNIARTAASAVSVSSAVADGSGATDTANNSTTVLNQSSSNSFWQTLADNLRVILGETGADTEVAASNIIINPESGLVIVRATEREHAVIQAFIDSVRTRSHYQVLIEATVVEVNLNEQFQAGVDWSLLGRDNGQVSFVQDLNGLNLSSTPTNILTLDKTAGPDAVLSTIRALERFGKSKVLSSPRIMALNNQTAMLRVVDSKIYFTIDVEAGTAATATSPALPPTFNSVVHTVPVGFTMAVTPQISENEQVTLNVRPTISRILRFVEDPNPALAEAGVINSVPEIQIREIESILKVDSGQVAILGGLMQDSIDASSAGLPGINRTRGIGNLFKYQDQQAVKTELIIFIRPVVIRNASINGDLQNYTQFLPSASNNAEAFRTTPGGFLVGQ